MAGVPTIEAQTRREEEGVPAQPAPEGAQGGQSEQLAMQIKELTSQLKTMVDPEVFANFVQSHVLTDAPAPTEAPRPVVGGVPQEGGVAAV